MAKKLAPAEGYTKRIMCNLTDYEYGELLAELKYENIKAVDNIVRHFIECYLGHDENARAIAEDYKLKNKIAGRAKKEHIIKEEKLAKKSEVLYNLNDEEIDDIYDHLDNTLE